MNLQLVQVPVLVPRMRVIRARVPWIILYLTCLSIYGFSMMIITFQTTQKYQPFSPYKQTNQPNANLANANQPTPSDRLTGNKIRKRSEVGQISSIRDFFDRLDTSESHCRKLVDVGGVSCSSVMDNNKLFCLDDDVYIHANDCNVYSFGVGDDISFDYQMSKYGCNVYMFDPTIPPQSVNESIFRLPKLHFFPLGIQHVRSENSFRWNKNQTVKGVFDTFVNVRKEIGHQNLPFHYLKMDIEGSEWNVLPGMVEANAFEHVKQFAIEIHATRIKNKTEEEAVVILQEMWNVLEMVKSLGFKQISFSPTLYLESFYYPPGSKQGIPTCGEVFYLKRTN